MQTASHTAEEAALGKIFSSDRDRGSDTAEPAAKPTPEAEATSAPPTADEVKAEPTAKDPETGRMVPLSELLGERKRYSSEKKLREEAEARAKAMEDVVYRLQQGQTQHQQYPEPDPYADPAGALKDVQRRLREEMDARIVSVSMAGAVRSYGREMVDEAIAEAKRQGVSEQFISRPDPFEDLIAWHKRQKIIAKIGDDPDAYEKNLEKQIEARILEKIRRNGSPTSQPPPRLPGTLVDATASGPQGVAIPTGEQVLGRIFATDRNRRA